MQTSAQWRSWLLLILCAGGGLLAFGFSAILLISGSSMLLGANFPNSRIVSFFNLAWVSALVGGLCIPGVVYTIRELRARPFLPGQKKRGFLYASAAMLLWAVLALLFEPIETSRFSWLFLPPLVVLVTIIPLWWFIEIARRGLAQDPPARTWGMIGFSLVITLPLTLVISVIALLVFLIGAGIYISAQPGMAEQLAMVANLLSNPNTDPQIILDLMTTWLQQPGVILVALTLVAGVFPLLEELLKPLAVWLFTGDRLNPAQGFIAGALCGGSFALWENLTALSTAGDGSGTITLLGRVGTGLLHVVTAGIVSWGMVSAWQDRRHVLRLVGAYLAAFVLHSSWNFVGLFAGIAPLLQLPEDMPGLADTITGSTAVILFSLVILNLILLLWINARFRNRLRSQPVPVPLRSTPASDQFEPFNHERTG
jgi:hypothetical protein